MPDPVSCHASRNDPSIIECDPVSVGPERPRSAAEKAKSEPGVRALVARHDAALVVSSQETIRVPFQIDAAEIAARCGGRLLGAALGTLGAAKLHPALAVLTGVKLGMDVGECAGETVYEATQRATDEKAVARCHKAGGTTAGAVDGVVMCERASEAVEP